MSAWEHWDALEQLLSDEWIKNVPDKLIERGWAPPENRDPLAKLLDHHDGVYGHEDDDEDYCKCGKWIEWGHHEWPDHVSDVLECSDLLMPGRPWKEPQ